MTAGVTTLRPFRIPNRCAGPVRRALFASTRPVIEKAMAFDVLNGIYARVHDRHHPVHFVRNSLDALGVTIDVSDDDLSCIPTKGPLVVVANHPFGGLEGLVLLSLLSRVRPDARVMANYMLHRIPDLRQAMFFVDPFDRTQSPSRNIAALRSAIRWVCRGGALGVFPAGEVAHLSMRRRCVIDPPWSETVARLIRRSDATVVPVYFDGRNSDLFQLLGLVHPLLRTVMLPRELLRKRDSRVIVHIGSPVAHQRLHSLTCPSHMTAYLRMRTYILKGRGPRDVAAAAPRRWRDGAPIVRPMPADALRRDIDALATCQRLLETDSVAVYYAGTDQLPNVLPEIGRLRETAFRAVGEGSGHAVDLDEFDQWYLHLFAWDRKVRKIIGAYRMGPTDKILPQRGKAGLYTATLFHYKSRLLEQIDPAIEMGRSFVHPDYQKQYAPLMLLWKGIGRYLVANPHYKRVFGPVSISNDYNSITKQLLIAFLKLNRYLPDLGKLIRAKNPPHIAPVGDWDPKQTSTALRDINDVNELVREIEADRKSMPILLRQYLKLNAKLLGFNVDPEFGDVLDGLMLIDVCDIDRTVLNRYLGEDGAPQYLAYHGIHG